MSFDYSNTSKNYLTNRYNFILQIEEKGIPKLQPYNDGKGWVTIGAGYNLSDANVRSKALAEMGITDVNLIKKLDAYLKLGAS